MSAIFTSLGRFAVRCRYPIVVAWVIITIVSVRAFPSLASVAKDTTSGFLPANAPSIQASNLAGPFQNSTYASSTIVAVRDGGPLTARDQAAMNQVETAVKGLPHVKL